MSLGFSQNGPWPPQFCWQTDTQTERHRQQDRHFPQPVAEVINWDSDPRQQSLLLELWSPVLTCHNVQAVSIRQNDPFQWSLHRSQRVSSFGDGWRETVSKSEEQRQGDILSWSVITGQCSFNHAICCSLHVVYVGLTYCCPAVERSTYFHFMVLATF